MNESGSDDQCFTVRTRDVESALAALRVAEDIYASIGTLDNLQDCGDILVRNNDKRQDVNLGVFTGFQIKPSLENGIILITSDRKLSNSEDDAFPYFDIPFRFFGFTDIYKVAVRKSSEGFLLKIDGRIVKHTRNVLDRVTENRKASFLKEFTFDGSLTLTLRP